jgi:hypothetical protein
MKLTPIFALTTCLMISSASASIEVSAELINSTEKKEAPADASADDKKQSAQAGAAAAGGAAPGTPKPVNQEKALKINVHNASGKPEPGLTVRYWFISRDMKTMKPALLDGGESSADLKPNGTTVVISDPVKASYTQRQVFMPKAAGGGGAKTPAPKPVEAGGTKVVGTAAQVIRGGKVVAEYFSEAAYKELVGSKGNNPGPLYKAPKPEEAAPAAQ